MVRCQTRNKYQRLLSALQTVTQATKRRERNSGDMLDFSEATLGRSTGRNACRLSRRVTGERTRKMKVRDKAIVTAKVLGRKYSRWRKERKDRGHACEVKWPVYKSISGIGKT